MSRPGDLARRSARLRRRRTERGLTLIELLISIALLALLTGFLAGGLSMARRAFAADRTSAADGEAHAGIQTLSDVIASALAVRGNTASQSGFTMFEGRQDAMAFVGLSEGRGLPGGLYRVGLRQEGDDLIVDFLAWASAVPDTPDRDVRPSKVAVLRGVRAIRLGYFGSPALTGVSQWHDNWAKAEQLPKLVSIKIEFEDERRTEPPMIVALRQGGGA